jgi:hypothetical protein
MNQGQKTVVLRFREGLVVNNQCCEVWQRVVREGSHILVVLDDELLEIIQSPSTECCESSV